MDALGHLVDGVGLCDRLGLRDQDDLACEAVGVGVGFHGIRDSVFAVAGDQGIMYR